MLPLFEMLENAQNGRGMDALARQFNLSMEQTRAAVEALLPAFSQGLKHNTADPFGVGAFMSAIATGQHAKYFEDAARAFTPQGMEEGNGILRHLFGSKELSRAIAAQAAQATGIGQEILKQMLPAMAAMIMGGLFKQSTGQLRADATAGNPLGEIIEQMMRQGLPPRQPTPQPQNPFDNPFGKVLRDMFGGAEATRQGRQAPGADNPLGRIFEEMLGGRPREEHGARAKPKTNPSGRPRNPYDDLFGEMFETGRRQRAEYQEGLESIFEQFRRGMDGHR